jgi:hypothetical protein
MMNSTDNPLLIAPCGMNCGLCMAYLRKRNKCPGCNESDEKKPVSRARCKIRICEIFENEKTEFCFKCIQFPCDNLKHLDKRYRTKYHMSMIENLEYIRDLGLREFLLKEKSNWTCTKCGGTICVHSAECCECGENIDSDKTRNYSVN